MAARTEATNHPRIYNRACFTILSYTDFQCYSAINMKILPDLTACLCTFRAQVRIIVLKPYTISTNWSFQNQVFCARSSLNTRKLHLIIYSLLFLRDFSLFLQWIYRRLKLNGHCIPESLFEVHRQAQVSSENILVRQHSNSEAR